MNKSIEKFRNKMNSGEVLLGPFMKTSDPMFVESAGIAGFDYAILDTEHGPVNLTEQQNNVRAAELREMASIIRVSGIEEHQIGAALDIGASGIQVPQIKCAGDAKKVVKYARFYPYGMRGVCRFVRAAEYSAMDRTEYFESSKDVIVIIQLEGTEALQNLEEILEVDGIDIVFIGPYDLSQSLGVPGQIDNPLVIEKMKHIVDEAKKRNVIVGTFVDNYDLMNMWKEAGVQYISYSVDAGIFVDACKHIVNHK